MVKVLVFTELRTHPTSLISGDTALFQSEKGLWSQIGLYSNMVKEKWINQKFLFSILHTTQFNPNYFSNLSKSMLYLSRPLIPTIGVMCKCIKIF